MIEEINGLVGGMVKMSIKKLTGKNNDNPSGEVFHLMMNPENYSEEFNVTYEKLKTDPEDEHDLSKYKLSSPYNYTFEFIIDGTGAIGVKVDVASEINRFKKITTFKKGSKKGSNNFLRLSWGHLNMKCIFQSASINYTLFSRTGLPLRAKITAKFEKVGTFKSSELSSVEQFTSKVVGAGQNLVSLTEKAYGNARKLAKIAQANNLNSFRNIPIGKNLLFLPISKL